MDLDELDDIPAFLDKYTYSFEKPKNHGDTKPEMGPIEYSVFVEVAQVGSDPVPFKELLRGITSIPCMRDIVKTVRNNAMIHVDNPLRDRIVPLKTTGGAFFMSMMEFFGDKLNRRIVAAIMAHPKIQEKSTLGEGRELVEFLHGGIATMLANLYARTRMTPDVSVGFEMCNQFRCLMTDITQDCALADEYTCSLTYRELYGEFQDKWVLPEYEESIVRLIVD
jgi:hypothetical protein